MSRPENVMYKAMTYKDGYGRKSWAVWHKLTAVDFEGPRISTWGFETRCNSRQEAEQLAVSMKIAAIEARVKASRI